MTAGRSFLKAKQGSVRSFDEPTEISLDLCRGLATEMPMCSFVQESGSTFLAERRRRRHRWSSQDHRHSSGE